MRACLNDGSVSELVGEGVPEGGCSDSEGPVTPGPKLGPWGFECGCIHGPEETGKTRSESDQVMYDFIGGG